jgi:putative hydrolase of the HAD superfamily
MFQGEGYQRFCARYGIAIDPLRFDAAVASAAAVLDLPEDAAFDAEIYVDYTKRIIEQMGGGGDTMDACAREIYDEWAGCHHFELYEEVPRVLRELVASGLRIGLISNSHRSLASFEAHFDLEGLIAASVSSSEHGLMKPHPSIFAAALQLAGVRPEEAVMVGDNLRQDVEGAIRAGMRGVLMHRSSGPFPEEAVERGVPVIRTLTELKALLYTWTSD